MKKGMKQPLQVNNKMKLVDTGRGGRGRKGGRRGRGTKGRKEEGG